MDLFNFRPDKDSEPEESTSSEAPVTPPAEVTSEPTGEGDPNPGTLEVQPLPEEASVAEAADLPVVSDAAPAVSFDFESESGFATLRIPVTETRLKSLPNQKVGEDFVFKIDDLAGNSNVEVTGLPEGISFNSETHEIYGKPTKDGQFTVQFLARAAQGSAVVLQFSLVIVPDPRTLWKNIPTDKNAPFFKPDYAAEVDSTQDIFAVAASNRGRSHAHEGKFREDDYSMLCLGPSTWSVFCVGDGGGSYEFSRRGSEVATKIASKKLASLLEAHVSPLLESYNRPTEMIHEDQEVISGLYQSLIKASFDAAVAVKDEAEHFGAQAKAFSTTLLLVAVKKFTIGYVVVGFNIGDGASGVIYNGGKDLYLLCVPESGEFAGQTRFLSTDEFKEENNQAARLRITVLPSFDAIAVMSDGVSDAKFPNDNALHEAKYWNELIYADWAPSVLLAPIKEGFPKPDNELKKRANDWLDYWVPGTHDDRTLIVAFPKEG